MVLSDIRQEINKLKQNNLGVIGLIVYAFLLPINQKLSTFFLISLTVYALVKIKSLDFKILKSFLPFILIYILYAIAYYKDYYSFGIVMFEQKASFIAFPLIFSIINTSNIKIILKYFVFGCISIYVISFIIALYNSININPLEFNTTISVYQELGGNINPPILLSNNFLANNFFQNMNSTFLAVYYSFSIYILLKFQELFKYRKLMLIIFVISIFQIFSVIGFGCLILVVFLNFKPSFYKPLLILIFSSFFLFSIFLVHNYNTNKNNNEIVNKIEKMDSRAIIWPSAISCFSQKSFFGFGVKKAQVELNLKYPTTGDFGFISQFKKIDAHNMYLQIILELGLLGFSFFIYVFLVFFKKLKHYLYYDIASIFMLLNLFLFITESALVSYAILSFFTFFYCLFFSNNLNQTNN